MDSKQPFFSICIPNYNYGHYIGETIESVLTQTFEDFEIVIQDNASTDNSWEVIQDFAKKDSRIRIFKNNWNVGFAPNLQKVTTNSRGRYIILLSSDDIMYPLALEKYHEVISKQDTDDIVICSNTDVIDSESNVKSKIFMKIPEWRLIKSSFESDFKPSEKVYSINSLKILSEILDRNTGARPVSVFCATCFSKKLWERVEGYDVTAQYSPDTNTMLKLLSLSINYIWIDKVLFGYRIHDDNNTNVLRKERNLKFLSDMYMRTLNLDSKVLELMGIDRADYSKLFIRSFCLRPALISILKGNWIDSIQLVSYSLSAYPRLTLKIPFFYLLFILNTVGVICLPFFILFSHMFKFVRLNLNREWR